MSVEGLRMYDELLAVHEIMRRGARLTALAAQRLAGGAAVDVKALIRLGHWQARFVHHHHASEDELFWPVLRGLFPDAFGALDALTAEHAALEGELKNLDAAFDMLDAGARLTGPDALAAAVGVAAVQALPAAEAVRDLLCAHLDAEEPILKPLLPQVADPEMKRLRAAIIAGAPRTAPDLVIGLLHDPAPAPGYAAMIADFPPPVRWLRPVLIRRYQAATKSLLG